MTREACISSSEGDLDMFIWSKTKPGVVADHLLSQLLGGRGEIDTVQG